MAFEKMENDLGEIKEILASASISNDELLNVQERIDGTGAILSETEKKLKLLDSEVANIKTSIVQVISKSFQQHAYLRKDLI